MDVLGKTIWVTGASSGIGAALSRRFSAAGAFVILSGRNMARLTDTAAKCVGKSLILPFDLTEYAALCAVTEQACDWRGSVDILVNNAGIAQKSLAVDTNFDLYRLVMDTDFLAPLRLTQLLLPSMVSRSSGSIIAVSSVAGRVGVPFYSAYCAAKHAMMGYFDALRSELVSSGIHVMTVLPGYVRTGIQANTIRSDGTSFGPKYSEDTYGLSADKAASEILNCFLAGRREITLGKDAEDIIRGMRDDPEIFFDRMAQLASLGLNHPQVSGVGVVGTF
jgi:dehydrogenase/reductase SDR family member 7B